MVPVVGIKFHNKGDSIVYTVTKVEDDKFYISWFSSYLNKQVDDYTSTGYTYAFFSRSVNTGQWIITEQPKKEIKPEVGIKFTAPNKEVYTISAVTDKQFTVSWEHHGGGNAWYSLTEFSRHLKEGNWKVIEQPMEKKIIGYNLVKKEYEAAALKIVDSMGGQGFIKLTKDGPDLHGEGWIKRLKEAGVLDLWFEPVYEPTEVTVNISNGRYVTIRGTRASLVVGGIKQLIDKSQLVDLKAAIDTLQSTSIAGYRIELHKQMFKLGCQTFLYSDIVDILKAFK